MRLFRQRPLIHVDDAAEAILKCPVLSGAEGLEAPLHAVKGQTFNVGSDDQNYQTCTERSERVAQLGHLIEELIPNVQVIHQGEDVDKRNYRVSFAKTCTERSRSIRKHLGFTPRRTVADGILEIKAAIEDGRIRDYRLPIMACSSGSRLSQTRDGRRGGMDAHSQVRYNLHRNLRFEEGGPGE